MRRIERKFPGYLEDGDTPGSGRSDGGTGEPPRG
jgi:hypothetical protein